MTSAVDASPAVVTLLFTDIVGSTELLSRLGDDAYEIVRRKHFRMLHEAVVSAGGAQVKNLGDGLMAVFPSAVDALGCAAAIQRAVARHNRTAAEGQFDVRVGLHVGEPIRDEEDYFGTPVVVAKRLCDLAEPGQILTSRLVVELAGSRGNFEFSGLGLLDLKGFSEPVAAFAVGWQQHAGTRPVPPAFESLRERAFVGRASEVDRLAAAWVQARVGGRQAVLIAGEPGIGKTTLAVRAAEQAAAEGAVVLFGRCDEESVVPFQPFVEAIAHYVETTPTADLQSQLGAQAADLALLIPGLERWLPEVAGVARTGAETERYRLLEAVSDLLSTVGAENAVVLVLDDLHWADRPTLQLLQHLIRRTSDVPMLILATYRDTDLVRTHPLAETLVDLRRTESVTRLPLRGLDPDDVLAMVVSDAMPGPDDRSLAEALWSETEGSPLFLREILRHLAETGAATRDKDGHWRARRRIDQLGIPEGVKEVIARRLTRLSDAANDVLLTGCVAGREFTVDVIERINDLDADAVLDALDEATAAGIVSEVPNRLGRYTFTHALVRQALYDSLSLTRRVRWHQRVGEALEAIAGDDDMPYLAELAYHFSQAAVAGHAEKAIAYCRRAGEAQMATVAYEEAARNFATALEVAEETGARTEVRGRLLLELGKARWRSADPTARAAFGAAAALGRSAGDTATLAQAALGYAGASVRPVWVEVGVVNEDGIALLEEAIDAVDRADPATRALLLATLARELYWKPGTRGRREQLSAEAVRIAREVADAGTLASVLANRWLATIGPDTVDERIGVCEEIVALAAQLGDQALSATASAYLAMTLMERGNVAGAVVQFEEYRDLAQQVKDPVLVLGAEYAEANLADLAGRFAEADKLRGEAFQIGQDTEDRNSVIHFLGGMIMSLRRQGRVAEAVGPAAAAIGLYPLLAPTVRAALSAGFSDVGDVERAREELALIDPLDPNQLTGDLLHLFTLASMSEAIVVLGDVERAAIIYDLLARYADGFVTIAHLATVGSVHAFLGPLASILGRHDDAVAHLRTALANCETADSAVLATEAQVKLAAALTARDAPGDDDEASRLAGRALATAEDLGMLLVARQAATVLGLSASDGPNIAAEAITRRERSRSRLTTSARNLVGRLSRHRDDADLVHRFGSALAQRTLFTAMAKSFQARTAFGFEGEIQFELQLPSDEPEPETSFWTIEVRGRRASARHERATTPAAAIRTALPDLVRLLSGELHPFLAVITSRAHVGGDVLLAARVPEMFGGFEAFEDLAERSE